MATKLHSSKRKISITGRQVTNAIILSGRTGDKLVHGHERNLPLYIQTQMISRIKFHDFIKIHKVSKLNSSAEEFYYIYSIASDYKPTYYQNRLQKQLKSVIYIYIYISSTSNKIQNL